MPDLFENLQPASFRKAPFQVDVIIAALLGIALFLQFGGMHAERKWKLYIDDLTTHGVSCVEHRQAEGPAHARKTYYVCSNGETVKWWERAWF